MVWLDLAGHRPIEAVVSAVGIKWVRFPARSFSSTLNDFRFSSEKPYIPHLRSCSKRRGRGMVLMRDERWG
jgi:hypothetical protein